MVLMTVHFIHVMQMCEAGNCKVQTQIGFLYCNDVFKRSSMGDEGDQLFDM